MIQLLISLPLSNDAIVFGLLMMILASIIYTSQSNHPGWKKFYRFCPALLLCYFVPALFNWPLNVIDPDSSKLYYMASRYLLPASLVLLCLSIDLNAIFGLGSKALIIFFVASFGIILGGPVALLICSYIFPDLIGVNPDDLWRGLSTVAGSWIGGGANQAAMKEIYQVDGNLFGTMIIVDILIGNTWLGFLLYGVNSSDKLDKWLNADNSAIESLKNKVEAYRLSVTRQATKVDLYLLAGIAFGAVGLSHLGAELVVPFLERYRETIEGLRLNSLLSGFFWLVVFATTIGVILSFTSARKLEGVGASKFGSIFIYILVATIGMQMNILEIFKNPGLFAIGIIWMLIHVITLIIAAKIIRAPFFFIAVGSTANVGGAASAPVVAAAFHESLAPVGVLLAVLGYALGTYGAIICAELMRVAATF